MSNPAACRGASSDVDVTGLCDAVGIEMADVHVADAMLAEAAAQLPRVAAGLLDSPAAAACGELPAVDSLGAGGSTKGNSATTTYRRVVVNPRHEQTGLDKVRAQPRRALQGIDRVITNVGYHESRSHDLALPAPAAPNANACHAAGSTPRRTWNCHDL